MHPQTYLAIALAVTTPAALSQTFHVNTTADTVDANPGDGICADANGQRSLRAAIMEANALAPCGQVRIRLQHNANYVLSSQGAGEDAAATGDLDVTANIRIDGRAATIDGMQADRIFDVMVGGCLALSQVTLSNGAVVNDSGGAVRSAGNLVLTRVQITASRATGTGASGGAIFNAAGSLEVDRCVMSGNAADRAGGAVEANAGTTHLRRSDVIDNHTGSAPGNGGGLHLTGAGVVEVDRCRFSDNTAAREGGALWNSSTGDMTVRDCRIQANEATGAAADDGGGGLFNDGGSMTVRRCQVWDNLATTGSGSGGGMFNNGGTLDAQDCDIDGNQSNRAGGGIEVVGGMTGLRDSWLANNATGASPGNGGGMHITGMGSVFVDGCIVVGNVASAEGGGLWNSAVGSLAVSHCLIRDNVASGAAADQGGGGLFNDGGIMNVTHCSIRENLADGLAGSGGGILNNGGQVTVEHCSLIHNDSQRAGGGIEANVGATTVNNCIFLANATGASPGNGGGLHLTGAGMVDIDSCLLFFNHASNEGGGLWNSATGVMTATSTFLLANQAPVGRNVFNDGGTFTLNGHPVP